MISEMAVNYLQEKLSEKLAAILAQQGNYLTSYFLIKAFDRYTHNHRRPSLQRLRSERV
jgi:hypothetical protein